MSKKRDQRSDDKSRPRSKSEPGGGSPADRKARPADSNSAKGNQPRRDRGGKRNGSWMQTHGRDLRFLFFFALMMAIYYVATTTTFARETFFPSYLRLNARMAGGVLDTAGYDINVRDQKISEPRYAVTVGRGCDAVQPTALFVSAVLASPVPFLSRLCAAIVGTIVLAVINLLRIISLLLTGIYAPKLFDAMHLDVWQALFIFLAILFWALWAAHYARRHRAQTHDESH